MGRSTGLHLLRKYKMLYEAKQTADALPALFFKGERTWSQHGEDGYLVNELGQLAATGFYVDVGANHPMKLSNTYRLYSLGMRGLTIEPTEQLNRLHRRFRPEDIQLCCGIAEECGVAKFYEFEYTPYSTFSAEDYGRKISEGHRLHSQMYKPVFRLETILRGCDLGARRLFALLSTDTEGWDEIVLRSNDWDRYRPLYVVVEQNNEAAERRTTRFLEEQGYVKTYAAGCNAIFKARDCADILRRGGQ
jgi:hypothetical protein